MHTLKVRDGLSKAEEDIIADVRSAAKADGVAIHVVHTHDRSTGFLPRGGGIRADFGFSTDALSALINSSSVANIKIVAETGVAVGTALKWANDLRKRLTRQRPKGRKIECDFEERN